MDGHYSAARALACSRCAIHKGNAQQPTRLTPTGWMCGYCVEQTDIIALYAQKLSTHEPHGERQEAAPPPAERPAFPGKVETLSGAEAAVLAALHGPPLTWPEIRAAVRMKHDVAHHALGALVARGLVQRTGNGRAGSPYRYRCP